MNNRGLGPLTSTFLVPRPGCWSGLFVTSSALTDLCIGLFDLFLFKHSILGSE